MVRGEESIWQGTVRLLYEISSLRAGVLRERVIWPWGGVMGEARLVPASRRRGPMDEVF